MELEIILLSKINQTQKDKYWMFSLIYKGMKIEGDHEGRENK
jgi:hypothetical protein